MLEGIYLNKEKETSQGRILKLRKKHRQRVGISVCSIVNNTIYDNIEHFWK